MCGRSLRGTGGAGHRREPGPRQGDRTAAGPRGRDGGDHCAHHGARPQVHGLTGRDVPRRSSDAGGSVLAVPADLSDRDERDRMFREVVAGVGAPDVLVNNAAVTFLRPLDEFPERRALLMFEMHVLAPLHLTQLALPAMRRTRSRLGAEPDLGRRRTHRRSTLLRVRPHGRLRPLRHGQSRPEPPDPQSGRGALRRWHRRQRGRPHEPRGDAGRGQSGPGQDRYRGHRAHHRDGLLSSAPATQRH